MQIKTITCHDVYNYGASLQALALQTYLKSLGHRVEIIDYKPDYLCGDFNLWSVDNPIYEKPVVKQFYLLAKLPCRLLSLKRKKKFDDFTRMFLKLTSCRYHSYEELKTNPPQADVYIAGSDQIWNTFFMNGRDPAFYLDFAPESAKRISYAASFATEDVPDALQPFVSRMLRNFDAISIRERCSLPLLEKLGRTDGIAVCDPVFLLTREQWEAVLALEHEKEDYILVYDTEKSDRIKIIAQRIAKEKNLRIYNVSGFPVGYADKELWSSSPIDFIKMVHGAKYIVSNSFHATAFSIIFERDFCVVNRTEGINERMKSLLMDYNLHQRLTSDYSDDLLNPIDYSSVIPLLKKDIEGSKKFLEKNCKNE